MSDSVPDLRRQFEREVTRVTDRLRGLRASRLAEELTAGATVRDAVRNCAQALADAVADRPRELPKVADRAWADVIAVVATDLLLDSDEDRLPAGHAQLVALRRVL